MDHGGALKESTCLPKLFLALWASFFWKMESQSHVKKSYLSSMQECTLQKGLLVSTPYPMRQKGQERQEGREGAGAEEC